MNRTFKACRDCDGRDGLSRRSFLRAGALSFMGLGLLDLLKVTAYAAGGSCDSVILVWLAGGPSHIDTFDPKPGQPTGGDFKAIGTAADGIQLCEHFPKLAKQMKLASLVRSLTNKEGSHERATYQMHTGYAPLGSIKHPSLGSLVIKEKGKINEDIPAYVSIGRQAFGAGFLGTEVAPFLIGDPNTATQNIYHSRDVPEERFKKRVGLLNALDASFAGSHKESAEVADYGFQFQEAVKMMRSRSKDAFDYKKEEAKLKDYGASEFGKSMLIAKRLVEQGVRFVEVSLGGWDTHQDNFKRLPDLCGNLDKGLATLIEDLNASGKLARTLVLCLGEFGRTPKINGQGGRDHYPRVWSAFLAGGGVKGGYVHGASDAEGGAPKDKPVAPGDLHATMFELLGVNHAKEHFTDQGRPIRIVDKGKAIKELMA